MNENNDNNNDDDDNNDPIRLMEPGSQTNSYICSFDLIVLQYREKKAIHMVEI